MNKAIIKSIDTSKISIDIPKSEELSINHLCIGMTTSQHTYLDRGNTRVRTTKYYDFGYGVENSTTSFMRVSFTLESIGKDEYATKKYYAWKDIEPNEKTRVWANLNYKSLTSFNHLKITEIAFGKTPRNTSDGAIWKEVTKPNRPVGAILAVKSISTNSTTKIILIVLLVLLASCLFPYVIFLFRI